MKKIKGKNYYRDEITEINKKNKNSYTLKELHKITDLFYRAYDDELYETLTEKEHTTLYCIRAILSMKNPKDVERTEAHIRAITRNPNRVAVVSGHSGHPKKSCAGATGGITV